MIMNTKLRTSWWYLYSGYSRFKIRTWWNVLEKGCPHQELISYIWKKTIMITFQGINDFPPYVLDLKKPHPFYLSMTVSISSKGQRDGYIRMLIKQMWEQVWSKLMFNLLLRVICNLHKPQHPTTPKRATYEVFFYGNLNK